MRIEHRITYRATSQSGQTFLITADLAELREFGKTVTGLTFTRFDEWGEGVDAGMHIHDFDPYNDTYDIELPDAAERMRPVLGEVVTYKTGNYQDIRHKVSAVSDHLCEVNLLDEAHLDTVRWQGTHQQFHHKFSRAAPQ